MAPPQWAYQVDNFDPPPDEELICSICRGIFCEPVQCPCNHVFCRLCITKWLQTNRSCPVCRKRATRYCIQDVVPLIKNMIMKLSLRCRNAENGCTEKFTLEGCEIHMKECVFEIVQCKNKPCKKQLLRKDIGSHEINDCPHRYTKCESCGLRISPISIQKHNCIIELKKVLQKKDALLKQKRLKIKELRKKIKTLKDNVQYSSDATSSGTSFSAADIMISFAEPLSQNTSSSEVSENTFSEADDDILNRTEDNTENANRENSAEFQESPLSHYFAFWNQNPRSVAESPIEMLLPERATVLTPPLPPSESLDADDSSFISPGFYFQNRSQVGRPIKRPIKRRHTPPPLFHSSDDDNNGASELPSLPSPKRCWRFVPHEVGEPSSRLVSESSSASSGQVSAYFSPGQSFPSTSTESSTSTIDNSSPRSRFNFKPKFHKKPPKLELPRKSDSVLSTRPSNGSAVFERTMALLEQYNLESDSEWLPEYSSHSANDSASDSDTSIDRAPEHITSSSESSLSEANCNDSSDDAERSPDVNLGDLISRCYETSDDDPEWLPNDIF